jgi:hypothetical protein
LKTLNNKSLPQSSDNLSINNKNNQQKTESINVEIKKNKPILNAFKNIFKSNNLPQNPVPPMEDINSNDKSELTVENDRESLIGMTSDDHDLKVYKTHIYFHVSLNVDMCINLFYSIQVLNITFLHTLLFVYYRVKIWCMKMKKTTYL